MVQFITRAEAIADPLAAKRKAMTKLRTLAELNDAETVNGHFAPLLMREGRA